MKAITLVLALFTFCFCAAQAQDLPNDLTAISQADAPSFATYYSIAYWPDYPPLPWNAWDSAADLYYSPTYGTSYIWVDDRAKVAGRMLAESVEPPPVPGGDDSGGPDYFPPQPFYDWTTNFTDLWIWLDSYTNAGDGMTYFFTIHNTQSGLPYEIISSTNVAAPMNPTNWYSEGVWLATSTNLSAYVPMGSKTNRNFFRAHLWSDFVYGVPTNGQVFMQSATSNIYPVINGVTNHLTPFWSNWFVLNPRPTNIYALNLGYAAEDFGFTNSIVNTNPPQQVIRFAGFSKTITNLCLSSNLLTTLNVSGWPALQDVEAWHNTNMLAVWVTNCPDLRRACFEAIQDVSTIGITNVLDFSGCNHLEEIRAADNRFPDVVIDDSSVSNVWHLCIHNNTVNQLPNMNFSRFPKLQELWIWTDHFQGPLILTHTNCPQLTSVEAFGNYFFTADLHGQTNLDHIFIDATPTLTNLNLSGCTKMTSVVADGDTLSVLDITGCSNLANVSAVLANLPSSAVDSVLIGLDTMGARGPGRTVRLSGNGVPSVNGFRAASNLVNKSWSPIFIPSPPAGTPNISNIAFTNRTATTATITWTTDISSDSTVYYDTTTAFGFSTNVSTAVTSHSVTLTGLTANTTYLCYLHSTSGSLTGTSGDNQFSTVNTRAIWFTNTSSSVSMQVRADTATSITWAWGDGTNGTGASASHTFVSSGSYSNAVVVDPASALTGFGLYNPSCDNSTTTTLSGVGGLTNYPNLQDLYLYRSGVSSLSLAGCSNLVSIALVTTSPSTNVENAWFNDLATAQPTRPGGTAQLPCGANLIFYFPLSPGTNATSASGCSNLVRIGWSLAGF